MLGRAGNPRVRPHVWSASGRGSGAVCCGASGWGRDSLVQSAVFGTHCRSLAIAAEGSTAELSTPWAAFAAVLFHSYAAS